MDLGTDFLALSSALAGIAGGDTVAEVRHQRQQQRPPHEEQRGAGYNHALVLCQLNPMLQAIETVVVDCRPLPTGNSKYEIKLGETILFPEGGGQPPDHGTIDNVVVEDTQRAKTTGEVIHTCNGPLEIGATVTVRVDFSRRYDNMQQHSAQHLCSAVAHTLFRANTVGWGLLTAKSYFDLDKDLDTSQRNQLLDAVNARVAEGLCMHAEEFDDAATIKKLPGFRAKEQPQPQQEDEEANRDARRKVRIVSIDGGVDANPCCGTHVTNTSRLQLVMFTDYERTKGHLRIYFVAGERAKAMMQTMVEREGAMAAVLSCKPEMFKARVVDLQADNKDLAKQRKAMLADMAPLLAASLSSAGGGGGGAGDGGGDRGQKILRLHKSYADMDFLLTVRKGVKGRLLLLSGGDDKGKGLFLIDGFGDEERLRQLVQTHIGGKGVFKDGMLCGKAESLKGLDKLAAALSS